MNNNNESTLINTSSEHRISKFPTTNPTKFVIRRRRRGSFHVVIPAFQPLQISHGNEKQFRLLSKRTQSRFEECMAIVCIRSSVFTVQRFDKLFHGFPINARNSNAI